jgi:8-oxo-dGTP pyrophosphatase MutT (NUDIX family)
MQNISVSLPRQDLAQLLSALIARATEQPISGSLPLYIAGFRCGWLFPDAAKALSGSRGVEFSAALAHLGRTTPVGTALDDLLAELALTLKRAGCTPGWRNELLDVWVNAEPVENTVPQRLGGVERGAMRALGLTTQAVHLSGWSKDGQLWVARRSLTKATDPGMWDTLVGGLVGHNEDPMLALLRESDEEAGLDAPHLVHRTPLRTIAHMNRRVPEGFQREAVLTCECVLPQGVIPSNRDGEVEEIACLDPETVYRMLKANAFTLEASIVITEDLYRRAQR